MPTRGDAATIGDALRSVLAQTHDEWEAIVMDDNLDGAMRAATETAVKAVQSEAGGRIRYFRGPGTGQLAELHAAVPYLRGQFVTMLHSDDMLVDPSSFARAVAALQRNGADGVYSDLVLLDARGRKLGTRACRWSPALLVASGGSNPLGDIFFTTRAAFDEHVAVNYIEWNMPYYFGIRDEGLTFLDLRRADPPWYGYRLADVPYATTEVGLFDKTNGELRTLAVTWGASLGVAPSFARGHYLVASLLARIHALRLRSEADPAKALDQFRACVIRKQRRLAGRSAFVKGYLDRVLGSADDRAALYAGRASSHTLVLEGREVQGLPVYVGRDAPRFFHETKAGLLPTVVARMFDKDYDLILCRGPDAQRWADGMMRFLNYLTPVVGVHSADSRDADLFLGVG